MFITCLLLTILSESLNGDELSCDKRVEDVCPTLGETCSVSCARDCDVFTSEGSVSLCGWMQSFGYDTFHLVAVPNKFNLHIKSTVSEKNIVKRQTRTSIRTISNVVYHYIPFYFIEEPIDVMDVVGSEVAFHCTAEGNSSLGYQWHRSLVYNNFRTRPPVPSPIPGATDTTYRIPTAASTDNGYYICVVTESGGSGDVYWSTPAKLQVLYIEEIEKKFITKTVRSGEIRSEIPCSLPQSYPAVIATWYKYDDQGVPKEIVGYDDKFYNPEDGQLYLLNTNRASHQGKYECRARNDMLDKTLVIAEVTITITGDGTANLYLPGKAFFDDDAARTATVGSEVVLRCAAYGNPIPVVYWTFSDDIDTLCKIPNSRYKSTDNGRVVEIYKVKFQDTEYRYQCMAEAPGGSPFSIGKLENVGIYKHLKITQDVLNYTPRYRTNVTLACPVVGQIDNIWYRNGERLTDNGDYYTTNLTANSLLVTASVTSHGVYTCLSVSDHGELVLKNLHSTIPVLPVTVHLYRDYPNEVTDNSTLLSCDVTGFPPPRVYWYENDVRVTDSSRYTFRFDRSNTTIINTTLNVSNLLVETEVKCMAVSQTEHYTNSKTEVYSINSEGNSEGSGRVENKNMYIIIGASCCMVLLLVIATFILVLRYKKEKKRSAPIRSYIKDVQSIQREGGAQISTTKSLREEFAYAAHLHDILKSMQIKDAGDIESFRHIIDDWANEELPGGDDSDFARRFRDSFISKRSVGNRLNSSNRYGNQFKLDLKNAEHKTSVDLIDETPERTSLVPLGAPGRRSSPRRASNPIYAPLPPEGDPIFDEEEEEKKDVLRYTAL